MTKNILVKIRDDYVESQSFSSNVGIVLRGPYEQVIKLTKNYSTCEPVYDLLISGMVHKNIPCIYCTKIKRKV
jgi:hypothetical protein